MNVESKTEMKLKNIDFFSLVEFSFSFSRNLQLSIHNEQIMKNRKKKQRKRNL